MTFNWFRRQYDDSDSQAQEVTAQEPSLPEVTEPATADPTPEEVDPNLAWAKLAFENIRKRKQLEAPEAETPSSTETAPVTEPTTATPEVGVVTSPAAIPLPEELPSTTAPDSTPTASNSVVRSPELDLPDSTAPLPFWVQESEAERLARLARLRQTAITEPDPVAPPVAQTSETAPALILDEGFLWSAEVLAAQGRRPSEISIEEITWLKRLRQGLEKTRLSLINQLKSIVGQGPLNQDAVLEIESLLLQADVGVAATDRILEALQQKLRQEVLPPEGAIAYLKQILRAMLDQPLGEINSNRIPVLVPEKDCLNIWLITGVNGAGKTTTIGKLAHLAQKSDYKCLIAAADTFRAAAVEQVKVWGQRSGVEVIANPGQNTDPAAVVFDAIAAAQSRGVELLLVDTAGRLQNKKNLMDELNKIRRIIDKKAVNAKVQSLLVLDATLGQNGLRQAEVFLAAAQLSGVVLTKLDGTAKGGIALAVVQQLGLPIRFIGAGEGIEDLRPFSSYEFVEALLNG